jgi:hypothetical protein
VAGDPPEMRKKPPEEVLVQSGHTPPPLAALRWCGTRTPTVGTSQRLNVWGTRSQGLRPQWPPGIERGNDLEVPLMALRTLPDIGACEPLHEGSGRLQAAGTGGAHDGRQGGSGHGGGSHYTPVLPDRMAILQEAS